MVIVIPVTSGQARLCVSVRSVEYRPSERGREMLQEIAVKVGILAMLQRRVYGEPEGRT
jgi:hypothetical protein